MNAYKQKPFFTFSFMDSLGTIVSFFSNKVKEKVDLIRELSLRASAKDYGKDHTPPQSVGQKNNVRVTETPPPTIKLQLIVPNLSSAVSLAEIHDRSRAPGARGRLLPPDRVGLQDPAEVASLAAVAAAAVGGFGRGARR